jgi:hypothetical protein
MKDDLVRKLKQIAASFGILKETAHTENIAWHVSPTKTNYSELVIGVLSDEEMKARILAVIHQIASAKDHVIKSAPSSSRKVIEEEIDKSFELSLIIDLANQDKHGYPLKKYNRTHKNPILKDFYQSLELTTAPVAGATAGLRIVNGEVQMYGAQKKIVVKCIIYDDKGNSLGSFDDIALAAKKTIDSLVTKYCNNPE